MIAPEVAREMHVHASSSPSLVRVSKRNTFFDFVDCAKALVAEGVAQPGKLTCEGRSAGGPLVGNVVNDAPELFAAALAGVPFVDLMVTMCDPTIPLTCEEWEEWGNPNEAKYHECRPERHSHRTARGSTHRLSPSSAPQALRGVRAFRTPLTCALRTACAPGASDAELAAAAGADLLTETPEIGQWLKLARAEVGLPLTVGVVRRGTGRGSNRRRHPRCTSRLSHAAPPPTPSHPTLGCCSTPTWTATCTCASPSRATPS